VNGPEIFHGNLIQAENVMYPGPPSDWYYSREAIKPCSLSPPKIPLPRYIQVNRITPMWEATRNVNHYS
jgi:hypothetical protein